MISFSGPANGQICARCDLVSNPDSSLDLYADSVYGQVFFTYNVETAETEITLLAHEIPHRLSGGHGFHIHEGTDETAMLSLEGGCGNLGGHFNPFDTDHGGPDSEHRHMGDLGNAMVDANGTIRWHRTDRLVTLIGEHSVIGRSVVLKNGTDDHGPGGDGNAGPGLACCIIQETNCSTASPGNRKIL